MVQTATDNIVIAEIRGWPPSTPCFSIYRLCTGLAKARKLSSNLTVSVNSGVIIKSRGRLPAWVIRERRRQHGIHGSWALSIL